MESSTDEQGYVIGQMSGQMAEMQAALNQLEDDYARLQEVAQKYHDEYHGFVNSRGTRLYLKLRKLLGGDYRELQEELPQTHVAVMGRKGFEFYRSYPAEIARLRASNGSMWYSEPRLTVGIISDTFMYEYYSCAARLVYLDPLNYVEAIESGQLDFVLYVSCWIGMGYCGDSETARSEDVHYNRKLTYGTGKKGHYEAVEPAEEVLRCAREHGVPVVFQTIEDPVSYDRYLPLARLADIIYTSAAEMVERYKADTGNPGVHVLEYGVNPLMHNPIGVAKARERGAGSASGALFAGAWYPMFERRCRDTRLLFDGVLGAEGANLVVVDRNLYGAMHEERRFPDEYKDYLVPPIDHGDLQNVHKLFDWTLNVNSVTDSETMCAMRVYEVQALGGLVMSNYALSTAARHPEVFTVVESGQASDLVSGYADDELFEMRVDGSRLMLRGNTVFDRMNDIAGHLGLPPAFVAGRVTVIGDDPASIRESIARTQRFCDVAVMSAPEALEAEWTDRDFALRWAPDGQWDDPNFLLDLVNACKYVDVDYVKRVPAGSSGELEFLSGPTSTPNVLFHLGSVSVEDVLGDAQAGSSGFGLPLPRRVHVDGSERDVLAVLVLDERAHAALTATFRSLARSTAFSRVQVVLADRGASRDARLEALALQRRYGNVDLLEIPAGEPDVRVAAHVLGQFPLRYAVFFDGRFEDVADGLSRMVAVADADGVQVVEGVAMPASDARGRVRLGAGAASPGLPQGYGCLMRVGGPGAEGARAHEGLGALAVLEGRRPDGPVGTCPEPTCVFYGCR